VARRQEGDFTFYLAAREDPASIKLALSFLNRKLGLYLDLSGFDKEIEDQFEKLEMLRKSNPDIDQKITMIEKGKKLGEEEELRLTKVVYEYL
jgi:hypothetical protein